MKDYRTYNFLEILKKIHIPFKYENDWLVVGENYQLQIRFSYNENLKEIPPKIRFESENDVLLHGNNIDHLGELIFNNKGNVNLNDNGIKDFKYLEFNNNGYVILNKNKLTLIAFLIIFSLGFLFTINTAWARQGCCSHHGGVCGCGCCDDTSFSATCAPYYPSCNNAYAEEVEIEPETTYSSMLIQKAPDIKTSRITISENINKSPENPKQNEGKGITKYIISGLALSMLSIIGAFSRAG